ncbi:MAG: hypothetical protein R3C53_08315 [Pirellulaceae bacterium]
MNIALRAASARVPTYSSRRLQPQPAQHEPLAHATFEELSIFRCLLAGCLRATDQSGGHVGQKVLAMSLVNDSPWASEHPVDRIDQAISLFGEQWLSAIAFMRSLAAHFHVCLKDCEAHTCESALLEVWQETLFLADSAELIARVSNACSPIRAWLVALLLGALEMEMRFNESLGTHHRDKRRTGLQPAVIQGLLAKLEVCSELAMPASPALVFGPWNALSAAHELTPTVLRVRWANSCLGQVRPTEWPAMLSVTLSRRIAALQPTSQQFATTVWDHAAG